MPSSDLGWLPRPGWRAWLAGGLAVVVVAVLLLARLLGGEDTSDARETDSQISPTTIPSPDDGLVGSVTLRPTAAPQAAAQVAYDFVRAWANPQRSAGQWWRQVSVYADVAFAERLRQTDPSRVPASKIEGDVNDIRLRAGSESAVVLVVPTDAGAVLVSCVLIDGQWRVVDLDIEPDTRPKGQPR